MSIRIGTSGWVYPHWRSVFYPVDLPQADWLKYYANCFDTVEINNTFYRLPDEAVFEKWYGQVPDGFLFAVKASRFLTHLKKLKDPRSPLETFFVHATPLGNRFGPVLYQLPPHWTVNLAGLREFLQALPRDQRHAMEFRDPSWLVEPVFKLLEGSGVALCLHDLPPLQVPRRVTAPFVYMRFHGDYHHGGDYQAAELERQAGRILDWQRQNMGVFVYFNNDAGGCAVKNARQLVSLLGAAAGRGEK